MRVRTGLALTALTLAGCNDRFFAPATFSLESISPTEATVGDTALVIVARGDGFPRTAGARWDGRQLTVTWIDGRELHLDVPDDFLEEPDTVEIRIFDTVTFSETLPVLFAVVAP